MKKKDKTNPPGLSGDLDSEYRFDYTRAKPNRFADGPRLNPVVVVLAPDVAVKALPRVDTAD